MGSPWGVPRAARQEIVTETIVQPKLRIPEPEPTSRVCRICERELPIAAFHRVRGAWYRTECRACRSKLAAATRDPRRAHDRHLRHTYGITLEGYEALLAAQGGVCAICGDTPTTHRFAVDHDHKTGKVRAILCRGCNTGIGGFRDDIDLLERAIAYLRKHEA